MGGSWEMDKILVMNQDGTDISVKVDSSDNLSYIAELRRLTARNGTDIFFLVAEAAGDDNYADGDEVILGVYFDRAKAEDALEELEGTGEIDDGGISAVKYLKAIGKYTTREGSVVANMTALEYLNSVATGIGSGFDDART